MLPQKKKPITAFALKFMTFTRDGTQKLLADVSFCLLLFSDE